MLDDDNGAVVTSCRQEVGKKQKAQLGGNSIVYLAAAVDPVRNYGHREDQVSDCKSLATVAVVEFDKQNMSHSTRNHP